MTKGKHNFKGCFLFFQCFVVFLFFLLTSETKICKFLASICISMAGQPHTNMYDCNGKRGTQYETRTNMAKPESTLACLCSFSPQTLAIDPPQSVYIRTVLLFLCKVQAGTL